MKNSIKLFLLLMLISFSGSAFSQPCVQISNQIEALRINLDKNRSTLANLEAKLRTNPRNLAKLQPHINKLNTEINLQKINKKKLQEQYQNCLVKNNIAKNKEEAKVIASTEKKMAKNAEIKKENALIKSTDNVHGDGDFVPIEKIKYTPAELEAKKKIKQNAKNNKSRTLNESAAVKAWKAEFKSTKNHTLEHTLNTVQLHSEFNNFLMNQDKNDENLRFYDAVSKPPLMWNLRLINQQFMTPPKFDKTNTIEMNTRDYTLNIERPLLKNISTLIINNNYIANDVVQVEVNKIKTLIINLMRSDSYIRFSKYMDAKAKPVK